MVEHKAVAETVREVRSEASIQDAFGRNKEEIYSLYTNTLRSNPSLQGNVVLSLTIVPSGEMTNCAIVSSELGDPAFEKKLIDLLKLIKFDSAQVLTTTVHYPIQFFPE